MNSLTKERYILIHDKYWAALGAAQGCSNTGKGFFAYIARTFLSPRKTPSWSRYDAKASGIHDLFSHTNCAERVARVSSI